MILDGVGVGELPDAGKYDDTGSNTLGNLAKSVGGLNLPNLSKLGLSKIFDVGLSCTVPEVLVHGCYGKMAELSPGKDTTTGHWEMMGLVLDKPFPTFHQGFPKEIILKFEQLIGRKTLGNIPASGTEIIQRLGDEHLKTGYPIVYTSADSVFQIAAHEDVVSVKELYRFCQIARDLLQGDYCVGRVIARPFIGKSVNYQRDTANRHDFGIDPFQPTVLDKIVESGGKVVGIGKIKDIFSGKGISESLHIKSNLEGIQYTLECIRKPVTQPTMIFTNLVDFDTLWGHRRDVPKFYQGLQEFDQYLPQITGLLAEDDLLIITADHGCDPTFVKHTDHTREYVPLLVYGKMINSNVDLGVRKTFADIGKTVAEYLEAEFSCPGTSFLPNIR